MRSISRISRLDDPPRSGRARVAEVRVAEVRVAEARVQRVLAEGPGTQMTEVKQP